MIECPRCGSDLTHARMAHECGERPDPPVCSGKPAMDRGVAMLRYVPETGIYVYEGERE